MRRSQTFIGLLRGINVGGHNKVPMSELRSLCGELGWSNVQTYIQSGNLIFSASGNAAALETKLQRAIESHFGFSIPIIVRRAADWPAYIKSNPFLRACQKEPHGVMLCLSQAPPKSDAAARLRERAASGERITQIGDALWIHFAGGVARSKLSPAVLDRMAGSPVTARNWLTVLKLQELANMRSFDAEEARVSALHAKWVLEGSAKPLKTEDLDAAFADSIKRAAARKKKQ
jgi:uncharacterized protein (DUF1697 family)